MRALPPVHSKMRFKLIGRRFGESDCVYAWNTLADYNSDMLDLYVNVATTQRRTWYIDIRELVAITLHPIESYGLRG